MDYPTHNPADAPPRRHKEYQDPHYHDADEVESPDDSTPAKKSKPARRIPPPVRRRYED
jgi:hypothetical protein